MRSHVMPACYFRINLNDNLKFAHFLCIVILARDAQVRCRKKIIRRAKQRSRIRDRTKINARNTPPTYTYVATVVFGATQFFVFVSVRNLFSR